MTYLMKLWAPFAFLAAMAVAGFGVMLHRAGLNANAIRTDAIVTGVSVRCTLHKHRPLLFSQIEGAEIPCADAREYLFTTTHVSYETSLTYRFLSPVDHAQYEGHSLVVYSNSVLPMAGAKAVVYVNRRTNRFEFGGLTTLR